METYGLFALSETHSSKPPSYIKIINKPQSFYDELSVKINRELDFSKVYETAAKMSNHLRKVTVRIALPDSKEEAECLYEKLANVLRRLCNNKNFKEISLVSWGIWSWPLDPSTIANFIYSEVYPFFLQLNPLNVLDLTGMGVETKEGMAILMAVARGNGHCLTILKLQDFFRQEDIGLKTCKNGNFVYIIKKFTKLRILSTNLYAISSKVLEVLAENGKLQLLDLICRSTDPIQTLQMNRRIWAKVIRLCPQLKLHLCMKNIYEKKQVCKIIQDNLPLESLEFWIACPPELEPEHLPPYYPPEPYEKNYNWLFEMLSKNFKDTLRRFRIHMTKYSACLRRNSILNLVKSCQHINELVIEGKMYTSVLDSLCKEFPHFCKARYIVKLHFILLDVSKEEKERFQRHQAQYRLIHRAIPDFNIKLIESEAPQFNCFA